MKFGKQLLFNSAWYSGRSGEKQTNVCSPLLFSCIFNDAYFINKVATMKIHEDGMTINQENILLDGFFKAKEETIFEQYNVFETNCKFSIPTDIIKDIWSDVPDDFEGECYLYLLSIVNTAGRLHKVGLVQDRNFFYYLDINNQVVYEYEHHKLLESFPFNNITNLSVLLDPLSNQWRKYNKNDFKHIVNI